jgi:hypothetical protein
VVVLVTMLVAVVAVLVAVVGFIFPSESKESGAESQRR